jgi:uncharacterized protein (TIGR02001 family)
MSKIIKMAVGAAAVVSALSVTAGAGWAAEEEKPKFTYSFNVGVTSDYVFRGYSQKKEDPAFQGGIDLSYAVLPTVTAYFGVWASGVDFGTNTDGTRIAGAEVDIYGGIKPTWGPATFDLGVIYYTYPGSIDGGNGSFLVLQVPQQNYVEFKAGVSGAFIPALDKLTTGATVYYSPSYQGGQGEVVTLEGTAAYELPKVWVFTPTLSGTIGGQFGSDARKAFAANGVFNAGPDKGFLLGNGEDSLMYYNVGLTLALEKFTFDFRYWNTDVKNDNVGAGVAGWCDGSGGNGAGRGALTCGERYVFTAKYTY